MPRTRAYHLSVGSTFLLFWAIVMPGRAPASAQNIRADESRGRIELAQAQDSGVSFSVYVDRTKNAASIREDGNSGVVVYEQSTQAGGVIIRPVLRSFAKEYQNIDILGEWKGDKPIVHNSLYDFDRGEPGLVLLPLFLTLDLRNNSDRPLQIANGYVAVDQSSTDLQPYLKLQALYLPECTDHEKLNPKLVFFNLGWGPIQNAKITYAFSKKFYDSSSHGRDIFHIQSFTFTDSKEVSLLEGLKGIGADISRLRSDDFRCASQSQLPQCKSQLLQSAVLGRIPPDSLSGEHGNMILVASVSGLIEYEWVDSEGATHQRRSKFESEFPLLSFKVPGAGAECGAGAPGDRDHHPLKLKLDRANYRLPIRISETIRPGEVKRLALNLNADKSSRHFFQIVLRSVDGAIFASNKFDFLFFKPKPQKQAADIQ